MQRSLSNSRIFTRSRSSISPTQSRSQLIFHGVDPRARASARNSSEPVVTRYSRHVRPVTQLPSTPIVGPVLVRKSSLRRELAPIASSDEISSLGSSSAFSTMKKRPFVYRSEDVEEEDRKTPTATK
ncbi:hypothetical protein Ciccas_008084 [Cichlidogyrus casuarinus]|uniref:Uncharacterized protein n=1 Tax=Cichlidogyrus casuarinus TaxID=1844966 RepID=A0ABD2Q1F8_9PLAT